MKEFFWTSGPLGWEIFTLVVFIGMGLLLVDLVWRLESVRIGRPAVAMSIDGSAGLV